MLQKTLPYNTAEEHRRPRLDGSTSITKWHTHQCSSPFHFSLFFFYISPTLCVYTGRYTIVEGVHLACWSQRERETRVISLTFRRAGDNRRRRRRGTWTGRLLGLTCEQKANKVTDQLNSIATYNERYWCAPLNASRPLDCSRKNSQNVDRKIHTENGPSVWIHQPLNVRLLPFEFDQEQSTRKKEMSNRIRKGMGKKNGCCFWCRKKLFDFEVEIFLENLVLYSLAMNLYERGPQKSLMLKSEEGTLWVLSYCLSWQIWPILEGK